MSLYTLNDAFVAYAAQFPEHPALHEPGKMTMTYQQVAEQAAYFAKYLQAQKIGVGCRVAILAHKQIETIAAIFGILQTGATYIPLDPTAPPARIRALIADLDPHALIAHPDLFPSEIPCQQIHFAQQHTSDFSISIFPAEHHHHDIAYILYTSGSTGHPKGVCISTENALHFVNWAIDYIDAQPGTRYTSIAPLHFDLSVFDIFVVLSSGGQVLLLDDAVVKNARMLASCLREWKPEVMYATPSTLRVLEQFGKLQNDDFHQLKHLLFAGEIFDTNHLHHWMNRLPQTRFHNLYGPTETNVCTAYEVPQPPDTTRTQPYPIGHILPGLQAHVHDCDETNAGELWIAGPQVFSGYWKQDEKTNEAIKLEQETRWYATGDRVRATDDGFIFLGRIDRMIKKRGYRIEPDEIELAFLTHPDVLEAAVIPVMDADAFVCLRAFLAIRPKAAPTLVELKQHIATRLPEYMIPEQLILLETLPKTSSGKIDLHALALRP